MRQLLFLLCCALLAAARAGRGQAVTYTDRGAFTNAANALLRYDLEAVTVPIGDLTGTGVRQEPAFTLPGVVVGTEGHPIPTYLSSATFTSGGGILYAVNDTGNSLIGPVIGDLDSDFPLTLSFASPVYAFGADFSSWLTPYYTSFTATLTLDTGESFQFTAQDQPNYTFFGFTSPTPVRQVTFDDGGIAPIGLGAYAHEQQIGNIFMVTQVPEPSALTLFSFGGLALLWRLSRRCEPTEGR